MKITRQILPTLRARCCSALSPAFWRSLRIQRGRDLGVRWIDALLARKEPPEAKQADRATLGGIYGGTGHVLAGARSAEEFVATLQQQLKRAKAGMTGGGRSE